MSFVYFQTFNTLGRVAMLELVFLLLRRVPETGVVNWGYIEVLGYPLDPRRKSINGSAR